MKKLLTKFVLGILTLVPFLQVSAQDIEMNPLDTLTSHVAGIRQELDVLKRIKINGYLQGQFQYGDSTGAAAYNGGAFAAGVDKRFMIRRGRIRFEYGAPIDERGVSTSQYVLQFDVSEKGLTIKDAYGKFTDPWTGWFSMTVGMQNRPFGFEIGYSSNWRESPERGRMSQILFPGERDLGAMLTIQAPKVSRWNWLKLEAGLFNGNGAPGVNASTAEFDKKKDFIGHLSFSKSNRDETYRYSGGFSYYNGGYRIDTVNVFCMKTDSSGVSGFSYLTRKVDVPAGIGSRNFTERHYYGIDGQFSVDSRFGVTTLRGEYIQGKQPGSASGTASPNSNVNTTSDIYYRNFNGAYFYFLQNIGKSKWQAIVKYDWYDPNTDVAGDQIGKSTTLDKKTNSTDIKYSTLGFGMTYHWDVNVKLTAYYESVTNETSANLSGYTHDLTDNNFTLRMQVKF